MSDDDVHAILGELRALRADLREAIASRHAQPADADDAVLGVAALARSLGVTPSTIRAEAHQCHARRTGPLRRRHPRGKITGRLGEVRAYLRQRGIL